MGLFEASPNDTWLFVLAHPDDEIAVAGWMHTLVQVGARVCVAWAHHTPVRRDESEAAMRRIGVPESNLTFGPFADRHFVDSLGELEYWVAELVDRCAPHQVVSHAWEQGHLDHDSLAFAVSRVVPGSLEAPYYHHYAKWVQTIGQFADPEGAECYDLPPATAELKRGLVGLYPSQTLARNVKLWEWKERLSGSESELHQREWLRRRRAFDPLVPAYRGAESLRIQRTREWKRWVARVRLRLQG